VDESQAFYKLRDKVNDGTPCGRFTDDICVDGVCQPAGCDHILGSSVTRDICGLCGGNGSTCERVHGRTNERQSYGWHNVHSEP
jgi:hypothetical protein